MHCELCITHCALRIVNYALCITHCALCITHCELCIMHYALITPPTAVLPFLEFRLGRSVGLWMPEVGASQLLREIVLLHKMPWKVVSIFVIGAITQLLHQLGGGITQVQRHGQVASLVNTGKCLVDSKVSAITLLASGKVDGTLTQRDAPFGPPYLVNHIEGGIGKKQGIGVGEAYILGGTDAQAASYELGVLATSNEAR